MRFVSFASSSKGNATLISYKNTNILVDCGISRKRIVENLARYDLAISDLDCIFITHEHSDHISGLPMLLKYDDVKIAGLRETLVAVSNNLERANVKANYENFKIIKPVNLLNEDSYILVNDIKVYPLKGCHDVPSLYYKFSLGDTKIAILTDMGKYSENVIRNLSDVNYLMLECNYDNDMLMESKRTEDLKLRILGDGGHLSNVDCCEIIDKISNGILKEVYLSHISDETNSEEYAFEFVNNYFNKRKVTNLPMIRVTKRLELTEIINNM